MFSGVVWSSQCSVGWSGVHKVVLKAEWRYGVKTNAEVCRGFLVWFSWASCYLPIEDKELSLESEIKY